jgi:hypothetical protein
MSPRRRKIRSGDREKGNSEQLHNRARDAKGGFMKVAIVWALLWALVVSPCAHADSAKIARPQWAIVMTITDRTTGAQLKQRELDSELKFEDRSECELIVAKVGPIVPSNDNLAVVLTCREVTRI